MIFLLSFFLSEGEHVDVIMPPKKVDLYVNRSYGTVNILISAILSISWRAFFYQIRYLFDFLVISCRHMEEKVKKNIQLLVESVFVTFGPGSNRKRSLFFLCFRKPFRNSVIISQVLPKSFLRFICSFCVIRLISFLCNTQEKIYMPLFK